MKGASVKGAATAAQVVHNGPYTSGTGPRAAARRRHPGAVISAYCAILCCSVADFALYAADLLGTDTLTLSEAFRRHQELRELATDDFLAVCEELTEEQAGVLEAYTGACCSGRYPMAVHHWAERRLGRPVQVAELPNLQQELRQLAHSDFRQLAILWGAESPFVGLPLGEG